MNGVSHMLPFVVGGGILIAIAFLIDGLNVDINSLSGRYESKLWYDHTSSSSCLNRLVELRLDCMLPVLAGFIAMSYR